MTQFIVIQETFGYTLLKRHKERPNYYWKYASRVNLEDWASYPIADVYLAEERLYKSVRHN